jgi:thioredoxin-like negative regulator of GroEL
MGPVLLLAGEVDEYQVLCHELRKTMTDRHGNALTNSLQICLLAPEADDPAALLKAANQAADETGDSHLLNVAYYRTGQVHQAITGLTLDLKSTIHAEPIIQLHLAIAHHLAGHQDEARTWLAKAGRNRDAIWCPDCKVKFEVLWDQAKRRGVQ